jgi:hypothetical protein
MRLRVGLNYACIPRKAIIQRGECALILLFMMIFPQVTRAQFVADQHAKRGLLVTTSRFLPSAQRFARRQNRYLRLATSSDVARWCKRIDKGLNEGGWSSDAAAVVCRLRSKENLPGLVGSVTHAAWGVTMVFNTFCLIIRESSNAVLMVELPTTTVSGCNDGYEIPVVPGAG